MLNPQAHRTDWGRPLLKEFGLAALFQRTRKVFLKLGGEEQSFRRETIKGNLEEKNRMDVFFVVSLQKILPRKGGPFAFP